jgi:5-methylcytosine-specific restriction protein A
MHLSAEPLCRICQKEGRLTAATDVDHIDGNVENMSDDNLQSLCSFHHKQKTVKENGAFGWPKGRPKMGI